ncbi:MAG TPA: hypothetical protein DCK97_08540, partial [Tistrella mobilis]|nr:hypothetical protein [Tistrella mobilis]
MTILSIRSGDFDVADRVEAFRNVVSTMTRVDVTPDDPATFHSETSIAILTDLMIGHGSHSASTAVRTTAHAADAGDNVMFHIPLSGGCSIAQTGGETAE